MHIEVVHGRKLVCGHIFPASEVKVGQHWAPADGSNREVVIVDVDEHYVMHKDLKTLEVFRKDAFGFQCRYCKVVDTLPESE